LAILFCPGCNHKLRIPDGKRGTVTCPHCSAEWFYPETIQLSDVEFRCSMSGARFNVISSRRSPLHKFVIQEIKKVAAAAAHPPKAEPPSSSQHTALKAVAPALSFAAPKVGGWLARIVGRNTNVVPSMPAAAAPKDQAPGASIPTATHNADEYNWSGFSCPYCNASSFVSGACGHLACDGPAELRNGRRFHKCFCGHAGFISGTIKNFQSKRLSVEAEFGSPSPTLTARQDLGSKSVDVALPPPTHGAPPAKR
jgi:uncharacterized Zn-finger protein